MVMMRRRVGELLTPELGERGNNQYGLVGNNSVNGNQDTTYIKARLKRDNPTLARQVFNNELSPHAAAKLTLDLCSNSGILNGMSKSTGREGNMADEWITALAAAGQLGISRRAVNGLVNRGRLEAQKFGNQWMIRRESVETYKTEKESK